MRGPVLLCTGFEYQPVEASGMTTMISRPAVRCRVGGLAGFCLALHRVDEAGFRLPDLDVEGVDPLVGPGVQGDDRPALP
ncbi:hypothetical protein ACGF5C_12215 [Micromonospora sp. NPDC047620]|uniref:hypothetical protein n=1 Tax=Micromonospora sp. NPDC047620 TaxID=3364251 RepID=UPI0037247DAD